MTSKRRHPSRRSRNRVQRPASSTLSKPSTQQPDNATADALTTTQRAIPNLQQMTPDTLLYLQRTIGNSRTQHLLRTGQPLIQRDDPPVEDVPQCPVVEEPETDVNVDAEGNPIRQTDNGKWYLDVESVDDLNLNFEIADGAKPQLLPINPNASYAALMVRCGEIRDEMLAIAEELETAGSDGGKDMKYWFAKVYYHVTRFEMAAIGEGTYQYPHMKMQEIILFYETYKQNYEAWAAGERENVEDNWAAAFAAAEDENSGSWLKPRSMEIGRALLANAQAHIRFDLPRAISAAYMTHYSGIPGASIGDFRADFFLMDDIFAQAQTALFPEIEGESWFIDPGDWEGIADFFFPFIFHMQSERNQAWERTETIVRGREEGLSPDVIDSQLRAEQTVRHPMQIDLFDVDGMFFLDTFGDEINDYDWINQPGLEDDPEGPGPEPDPAPPPPPDLQLYFRYDKPRGSMALENALRGDQDASALQAFVDWTCQVEGAVLRLRGRASSEGTDEYNDDLGLRRAALVREALAELGADFENNSVEAESLGEVGSTPDPDYRYVHITVEGDAVSKHQSLPPNPNLPSEVHGR